MFRKTNKTVRAKAPGKRKIKLLFFPEGERFLLEVAPFLNFMAELDRFSVHILMKNEPYRVVDEIDPASPYDLLSSVFIHDCPAYSRPGEKTIRAVESAVVRVSGKTRAADVILNLLPMVLVLACLDYWDFLKARIFADRLLRQLDPDVLAVTRDRNLGLQTAMIRWMRKRGRKVVIVPWGYPNTAFLIASRKTTRRNQLEGPQVSIVQLLSDWFGSRHIITFEGKKYSYYKPGRYLAAVAAGICPGNPFAYGSDTDLCLVDSSTTKDFLVEHEVPEQVISIAGNPVYDSLYLKPEEADARKKAIKERLDCATGKMLIFAVPHIPEHNLLDWDTHRNWLRRMVRAFLNFDDVNVVISLHPRSDPNNYKFLEEEFPVKSLDTTLRHALPAADYFICHWSGTTVWGPLLKVPTLIVDIYGVQSLGFEYLRESVQVVETLDGFDEELRRFFQTACVPGNESLPPFDGKARERCANEISKLLDNDQNAG